MQRRFFSFVFAASFAGLCFVACSGESEGQRCETTDDPGGPDNSPGSSDCSGNLVCTPASSLGGQAAQWARSLEDPTFGICCPQNRANATTSVCANQPSPPGGDASIPGDSSATSDAPPASDAAEAATSDAATDAPADGGSDSATDAPADAPADSPDAG